MSGWAAAKARVHILHTHCVRQHCHCLDRNDGVYGLREAKDFILSSQQGCISRNIRNLLLGEGLIVSHVGIYRFLKRFEKCGTLARRRGSGRPSKITDEVKRIEEAQMQLDDETTAVQLRALLAQKGAYYLDYSSIEL